MTKNQQAPVFKYIAEQPINKVCLFLAYDGNLILIVRHHAKDNSVSIEPPGGKIDPKANGDLETPREALVRESSQEIGVLINPIDLMSVELHPYTGKPVGHYYCEHVSETPYNKASDEHLGILELPLGKIKNYDDLKLIALDMAQKIVEEAHTGEELSRPIEFRVSEPAFKSFFERFTHEFRSDFTNLSAENSPIPPMPA